MPDGVLYVANDEELNNLSATRKISKAFFGQMPTQTGYCNGYNVSNDYIEYHRCSEINIAVTDMILEVGKKEDLDRDYTYDKSKLETFYVPAGTMVELYGTTLHYAPISANGEGFRCVVILPMGTNEEIHDKTIVCREDVLLAARNKWLIKL